MTSSAPQLPDPLDDDGRSDEALLAAARRGSMGALGVLYERHRGLALSVALRNLDAADSRYAEDVAEAGFVRVMNAIRNGRGPKDTMPAYLATAVRHEAWEWSAKLRRSDTATAVVSEPIEPDVAEGPLGDPVELNRHALLAGAFRRLQPRWRHALWLAQVEGRKSGEVAKLLGVESSVARALLHRARKGFVSAYVATYLELASTDGCDELGDELVAYLQADRPSAGFETVNAHLESCRRCRDMTRGVDVLATDLAAVGPVLLFPAGVAAAMKDWGSASGGSSLRGRARRIQSTPKAAVVAAAVVGVSVAAAIVGLISLGDDVSVQDVAAGAGATTSIAARPTTTAPSSRPGEGPADTTIPPASSSTTTTTVTVPGSPPSPPTTVSPGVAPVTTAPPSTTSPTTSTTITTTPTTSTTSAPPTTTSPTTTTTEVISGASITGRVRDATSGTTVDIADTTVAFTWSDGRGTVQTSTGPDGRFVLELTGTGRGSVTAWFPTSSGSIPFPVTTVTVNGGPIDLGDIVFTRR